MANLRTTLDDFADDPQSQPFQMSTDAFGSLGSSFPGPSDAGLAGSLDPGSSSGGSSPNIADQMGGQQPSGGSYNTGTNATLRAPGGSTVTDPNGQQVGGGGSVDFSGMMSQIESAGDPVQRETLRDQLARNVYSSLQGAGHDVKWQGSQLMVDGRPYVIAGGSGGGSSLPAGAKTANAPGAVSATQSAGAPAAGAGQVGQYAVDGMQADKFNDPTYSSPKYEMGRLRSQFPPTAQGEQQFVQQWNATHPDQPMTPIGNDKVRTYDGDTIDWIRDEDGANPSLWFGSEAEYAKANQGAAAGGQQPIAAHAPTAPGLQLSTSAFNQPSASAASNPFTSTVNQIAGTNYGQSALPPGATPPPGYVEPYGYGSLPGGATPGATGAQGPYTPGNVPMDVPGFNYNDMLAQANGGAVGNKLSSSVEGLLDNPESLNPQTVATLKAKSKDELAEMAANDDNELKQSGAQMGISDSNWLASERNARRWQRNADLVKSNRDIDINAATTNAADRRSAIAAGTAYQQSRQQGVQLAADTALRSAAAQGDRYALIESLKQKAAELGISAQQVQIQFTLGLLDDATRRYGIDISRDVDLKRIASGDAQYAQDIAFRYAQLGQQDRQFGAGFGLDAAKLQNDMNQTSLGRYLGAK